MTRPLKKRKSASQSHRELVAFKRRIKRAAVEAGLRGWLTPPQAKFLINKLGLRHE